MGDATPAPGSSRYSTEHRKMRRLYGSARNYLCEGGCGRQAQDWAMVHGRTGLEPMIDRVPLCKRCHIEYDQSGHRVPHTAEARAKISAAGIRRGSRTAEERRKLSEALTGRKQSAEHVQKSADARRGQKRSPEARRRMSEAAKLRSAREPNWNARKTHCDSGHEFTPENTYDNHGNRGCRECKRKAGLAWYHRNKGAA